MNSGKWRSGNRAVGTISRLSHFVCPFDDCSANLTKTNRRGGAAFYEHEYRRDGKHNPRHSNHTRHLIARFPVRSPDGSLRHSPLNFGSGIGFILNICYWRIAFSKKMKTVTRKVIWSVSTLFNLALLVGLTILLLTPPRSVGSGWLVLWICAVFLMGLFSIGGFVEEFRTY